MFWKRVKQMVLKKTNVQSYTDGFTKENDIAELFSEKYRLLLEDSDSQAFNSDGYPDSISDPENCRIYFQSNLDETISKSNSVVGWDNAHSGNLKYSMPVIHLDQ